MDLKKEKIYFKKGWRKIIGLDEAGRGSLAGPVYAAAVMIEREKLPLLKKRKEYSFLIENVKDSKKLSSKKRKEIFELSKKLREEKIINYQISFISEKTIDKINIDKAVRKAMEKNLKKFQLTAQEISHTLVLVDGNRIIKPTLPYKQIAIVKGDNKIFSIALASILTKVQRDKNLEKLSQKYPQYNFDINKGYPTFNHKTLLKTYGPSLAHRQTFQPVKYLIKKDEKK